MKAGEKQSLEQIQAFLEATGEVDFKADGQEEVYAWLGRVLKGQEYGHLSKGKKGLVRQYIIKVSGRADYGLSGLPISVNSTATYGMVAATLSNREYS